MELIVTEKEIAARRIAEILSDGTAEADERGGTTIYRWGDRRCIGLAGHVVEVDFPPEYSDWQDVEPRELADAAVRKRPTKEGLVATLKELARNADRVHIATDYDREGELIGKEAYELIREVDETVPIDRVRFSSITDREVTEAFATPDEIDFELAAAGEARQIVDLLWGAALTRFLSLAAGQLGEDFISVGRVQSPTLKLIVDREREIEAFEPEDYWELYAELADGDPFEAQYFYREDGREAERIHDEAAAEAAHEALSSADTVEVIDLDRRHQTDTPPAPFDTTAFISAAGSLGYGAQRAMSVAEDLYTAGYITYPRTDNTVYPDDLDPEALLDTLSGHDEFAEDAMTVLEAGPLEPTAGDEESTDHPPIHPTGELPERNALGAAEWELYELVVRRFLATLAPPAEWARLKVLAETPVSAATAKALPDGGADGALRLKANGKRLLEPGYHAVYPYSTADETHLPELSVGERLSVADVELAAKQTQPPRRYGQSRLVETMADMGIGTKSTRHNLVEKLYDRGYVEGDPPRPTRLARAVVTAAEEYADHIVDEAMTQQLERDMTAIAEGEIDLDAVTEESREMLRTIFEELVASREEIGQQLTDSLKADQSIGPCPDCGEQLLVRENRYGGHFIGCDGYPDCEFTLPLPDTGEPLILDRTCEDHNLHHIKMLAGRNTFVHGCPLCVSERAGEGAHLGPCPACGETDGGELAIKRLENGTRLVGCTRYPDCEYSVPLPRRGELVVTDERCELHDLAKLEIHDEPDDDDPWELGCPVCNYRAYQARESESGTDLEALDGVGPDTASKFVEAGVESIQDLAAADPETLAETVDGVSADRIRDWQRIA